MKTIQAWGGRAKKAYVFFKVLIEGRGWVRWQKEELGELTEGRGWVSWQKEEAG